MGIDIKLSSKGQVVIPKDIRDALGLKPGETLHIAREGRRIVMEAPIEPSEVISYAEFKRRVPPYSGPPISIDDMRDVSAVFGDWKI